MFLLPRGALALLPLASRESARWSLDHLRLFDLGGEFRLEASDGRVLGILRGATGLPEWPGKPPRLPGAPVLVSAREFKAAAGGLPKGLPIGVAASANAVLLHAGGRQASLPVAEGRFPDVATALPKRPAPFHAVVNPHHLINLLKAAAAANDDHESPKVQLLFWSPEEPLAVTALGPRGLAFDSLLMPLA